MAGVFDVQWRVQLQWEKLEATEEIDNKRVLLILALLDKKGCI